MRGSLEELQRPDGDGVEQRHRSRQRGLVRGVPRLEEATGGQLEPGLDPPRAKHRDEEEARDNQHED
jgi:hypothetical protein